MFSPVKLSPIYKNYLWGGSKLASLYGKISDKEFIAESWELSTHEDGLSQIASGSYAGCTLKEYIGKIGIGGLGIKANTSKELPVLIKFIDAGDNLSVQVHPDNLYAKANEGDNGKTEMWVVLEHEPDAFLYLGVNQRITKENVFAAIEMGKVDRILRKVPVRKGDIFFIPAGTIHAIGKGIVICEIQQCSNVTYRIFDFNRVDSNGSKRPLHIEKALDVADLSPKTLNTKPELVLLNSKDAAIKLLRSCPYFMAYLYQVNNSIEINGSIETFIALIVLEGVVNLHFSNKTLKCGKGETIFIPAQDATYEITGTCQFLAVTL